MGALENIDTIVIVMMENRSFDHMLGHLRHPAYGNRAEIDGLVDPSTTSRYDNDYDEQAYKPFAMADQVLIHDPPHKRAPIATQLDVIDGQATMSGFVRAWVETNQSAVFPCPVLGFLTPKDVPIHGFFAEEYLVCNRWFAALPSGTQPNRSMAFTGTSLIEDNATLMIPYPKNTHLFDWLNKHGLRWRVYHSGLSSFLLFGRFADAIGPHFRSVRDLEHDVRTENGEGIPQVIIVEAESDDSIIHLGFKPNDNHPPLPVRPGERFLRDVYTALTARPERWKKTLLIVTHDEHGGFYDHVEPPAIRMSIPQGAQYHDPFETAGVRVPTLLISPWVDRRSVDDTTFDHTSILQLLAEKFTGSARGYSAAVNERLDQGIASASVALKRASARADIPAAPVLEEDSSLPPAGVKKPKNENQQAYGTAARRWLETCRADALGKFPDLAELDSVPET